MSDRRAFSPTQLSQLDRCEQQWVLDRKHGTKRSRSWRARAAEGTAVHARLHRQVTKTARPGARQALMMAGAALVILMLLALFIRFSAWN